MKPTDELIEKFRQAYIREFGEEITHQEAYEKFLSLTNLLMAVYWPDPVDNQGAVSSDISFPGFDHD